MPQVGYYKQHSQDYYLKQIVCGPCVIQSRYRLPTPANIYKVWIQQFDMLRQICEFTRSSPEFVKRNLSVRLSWGLNLLQTGNDNQLQKKTELWRTSNACLFHTVLPFHNSSMP